MNLNDLDDLRQDLFLIIHHHDNMDAPGGQIYKEQSFIIDRVREALADLDDIAQDMASAIEASEHVVTADMTTGVSEHMTDAWYEGLDLPMNVAQEQDFPDFGEVEGPTPPENWKVYPDLDQTFVVVYEPTGEEYGTLNEESIATTIAYLLNQQGITIEEPRLKVSDIIATAELETLAENGYIIVDMQKLQEEGVVTWLQHHYIEEGGKSYNMLKELGQL